MKLNTKNLTHFLLIGAMACALAMLALGTGRATAQTTEPAATKAAPNAVTAIDILLEPDATMIKHATATNDSLRKVFPKGFALDAEHRLPDWRGRLPPRPLRHGSEEAQAVRPETLSCLCNVKIRL